MKDFESLLELRDQTLEIGGQVFTFREMTGEELRAYLRRVEAVTNDTREAIAKLDEATMADVAEAALPIEEEFFARLLSVEPSWVREHVTGADKERIFAAIDKCNSLGATVGNWQRLRAEAGALKALKSAKTSVTTGRQSVISPRPTMDASPGTFGEPIPPAKSSDSTP